MHKSNASTDNNRSKRDLVSENKSRALISQGEDRKLESQQSKFRMSVPQSRKTLRDQEEIQEKKVIGEGRTDEYGEEEEEVVCLRFPHLTFCPFNYQAQVKDTLFQEILDNIYVCGFAVGLTTKFLLIKGITNILNVTSMEYTKRTKYFKYLNIDIHNTSDEDIKKHFRISNRFIRETIQAKGKVLIHCRDGLNIGPCFVLAYMINENKTPLKTGMDHIQSRIPNLDIANHFQKQLEQYDLEKLALLQLKKKE